MASFGDDLIAIGSGFAASVTVMRGRAVFRADRVDPQRSHGLASATNWAGDDRRSENR
jgi:hypothetical protein